MRFKDNFMLPALLLLGTVTKVLGLAAPALPQGAIFSNDGLSINLVFDKETNKAGYTTSFPCDAIFSFDAVEFAYCEWVDKSEIAIYTGNDGELSVGSIVIIIPSNQIRAACVGDISIDDPCSGWPQVSTESLVLQAPISPTLPRVLISVPNTIGACSGLVIDLSSSTGAAGKDWSEANFFITSSDGDSAGPLDQYIVDNVQFDAPFTVPSEYMQSGVVYYFSLVLCNFLDACNQGSAQVTKSLDPTVYPFISINGDQEREVARAYPITLTAVASILLCGELFATTSDIDITWTVKKNFVIDQASIVDTTIDPGTFLIPAYALDLGSVYEFTALANYTATGATASYSTYIGPIQSDLVAILTGGEFQSVQAGKSLVLDASSSYDMDIETLTGSSAGLIFSWTCTDETKVIGTTCPLSFDAAAGTEVMSMAAEAGAAAGAVAIVTVEVSDGFGRSAEQTVYITIIDVDEPTLRVISPVADLTSVNTRFRFSIQGEVQTASKECTTSWSTDLTTLDLETSVANPMEIVVAPFTTRSVFLQFYSNSLPVRAKLGFTLHCGASSTLIYVTTNGPPFPGTFTVDPPNGGVELSTKYQFVAAQWTDSNLPLYYVFGFYTVSGDDTIRMVVRSKSTLSVSTTLLAAPNSEKNNSVRCFVEVYDALDAMSIHTARTAVDANVNETARNSAIMKQLAEGKGDLNSLKQAVSVGSSSINKMNCSWTPYTCMSLHRQECSSTALTCGPCMKGYLGDSGDGNTECVPAFSNLSFLSTMQKACQNNCSGHGSCVKVIRATGVELDSCSQSQDSCNAKCKCDSGYAGRDCSISESDMSQRRTMKSMLLTGLQSVTNLDAASEETVGTWSSTAYSLAKAPSELDTAAAEMVMAIVEAQLNNIMLPTVSLDSVSYIAQTIDFAANAMLSEQQHDSRDVAKKVVQSMRQYGEKVVATNAPDEAAVSVDGTNFKSVARKVAISADTASSPVELELPLSEWETAVNKPHNTVSAVVENAGRAASEGHVSLNVISSESSLYGTAAENMTSNPMHLQTSQGGLFTVTFQHKVPMNYTYSPERFIFNSTCPLADSSTVFTYTCPYSEFVIIHDCSTVPIDEKEGFSLGADMSSHCPVLRPFCPLIDAETGDIRDGESCKAVSFNENSTTCECSISDDEVQFVASRRRRLSTQSVLDDSGMMSFVSISEYISIETYNTLSAADELTSATALKKSLAVILMFSVLWGGGFIMLLACAYRQRAMMTVNQNAQKQLERKMQSATKSHSPALAREYLVGYIASVFPAVFGDEPPTVRFLDEIKVHHRYLTLFTAPPGEEEDKARILSGVQLLSIQTMLIFLLGLLYDLQGPADDGTCESYVTKDECLSKTSFLDTDQTYCKWKDHLDPSAYSSSKTPCVYREPVFTFTTMMYIAVIVSIFTSLFSKPIDMIFEVLTSPTADAVKAAAKFEESVIGRAARRVSNAAISLGRRAANAGVATANAVRRRSVQLAESLSKFKSEKLSVDTGNETLIIPESTKVAHSLAAASMKVIYGASQARIKHSNISRLRSLRTNSSSMLWSELDKNKNNTGGGGAAATAQNTSTSSKNEPHLSNIQAYESSSSEDETALRRSTKVAASTGVDIESGITKKRAPSEAGRKHRMFALEAQVSQKLLRDVDESIYQATNSKEGESAYQARLKMTDDEVFERLALEISCQRRVLSGEELDEFDAQWGLDPSGMFAEPDTAASKLQTCVRRITNSCKTEENISREFYGADEVIHAELCSVRKIATEKVKKLSIATDTHAGLEIIHLFIQDVLGRETPAARIFQTKSAEDFRHSTIVTSFSKRVVSILLVLINLFFIYYTILQGYVKGVLWQRYFVYACVAQFIIEIVMFETMECLWINFFIPSLVSEEVHAANEALRNVAVSLTTTATAEESDKYFLQAPDYLHVSAHVARAYPNLMESTIVRSYHSHLPGELSKKWVVGSVARIRRHNDTLRSIPLVTLILFTMQRLATAPFLFQRMFIRFVQPFILSALFQLALLLYEQPILGSIVLVLLGMYIVYFIYKHFRDKHNWLNAEGSAPLSSRASKIENIETYDDPDAPALPSAILKNVKQLAEEENVTKVKNTGMKKETVEKKKMEKKEPAVNDIELQQISSEDDEEDVRHFGNNNMDKNIEQAELKKKRKKKEELDVDVESIELGSSVVAAQNERGGVTHAQTMPDTVKYIGNKPYSGKGDSLSSIAARYTNTGGAGEEEEGEEEEEEEEESVRSISARYNIVDHKQNSNFSVIAARYSGAPKAPMQCDDDAPFVKNEQNQKQAVDVYNQPSSAGSPKAEVLTSPIDANSVLKMKQSLTKRQAKHKAKKTAALAAVLLTYGSSNSSDNCSIQDGGAAAGAATTSASAIAGTAPGATPSGEVASWKIATASARERGRTSSITESSDERDISSSDSSDIYGSVSDIDSDIVY